MAEPRAAHLPEEAPQRLLAVVARLVRETHAGRPRPVGLDSDLERDLGLDSLARVELVLRLGREFGVTLPDAALSDAATPRELLSYLGHAGQEVSAAAVLPDIVRGAGAGFPQGAQTLVEALEHFVAQVPQQTHILLYGEGDQVEAIAYGALFDEARRIATGLVGRGLRPRQTVALMLPTGRAYLASFFGVLLAGAIPVPIYPPARLSQIEEHLRRHGRILDNAGAAFIITEPQAKPVALLLRTAVPTLSDIVTPEELAVAPMPLLYRASPEDVAFLQYTSGSTGDPKGVVLTHANLLANIRAMGQAAAVTAEDVFVSWLPLYHDMGLIGAWLGSLCHGFPLVLMSPLAFLARPARWLQALSRHRGTLSAAPNFAYELCARKLDDADLEGVDLSAWRLAFNGAEPVSPATLAAFNARFAHHGLRPTTLTPVYGLAECSVGLAFPPLGRGPLIDRVRREPFLRRQIAEPAAQAEDALEIVACGRALPGHEMRVVDGIGAELPERHVGRLQFRGPSATSGYYRNPEATRRLFQGDWLDTGDYAYLVAGEVYLTGRVKDVIIRAGRNIYPYELEQAVGELPGVRRGCVAVFGSADPAGATERLVVLAETREQDPGARDALRRRINETALDVIGMPVDEIVLAPPYTVLKTSSGKIRRAASREVYEQGLVGRAAPSRLRLLARLFAEASLARARFGLQHFLSYAYGAYAWILFVLLGLPVAALVVALRPPRLARRIARLGARIWLRAVCLSVGVRGLERLPRQPHIFLVNHASYLDGPLLTALLPPCYAFVAKRELTGHGFFHAFLYGLGTRFVERFDAGKGAEDVDDLVTAVQSGQSLVVFPEGTFSREAGLKPFRMGAFVAAARGRVPVVVAGLRGVRQVLRDGTWLPRRGAIELEIGAALAPADTSWAEAARLREAARAEMLRLCGEHDSSR
jgi:acyl carrier protein